MLYYAFFFVWYIDIAHTILRIKIVYFLKKINHFLCKGDRFYVIGTAFLNKWNLSGSNGSNADTKAIRLFTKTDERE